MSNLTRRLMSDAVRCMRAAATAKRDGDTAQADWNRFLAHTFFGLAEDPDGLAASIKACRRAA